MNKITVCKLEYEDADKAASLMRGQTRFFGLSPSEMSIDPCSEDSIANYVATYLGTDNKFFVSLGAFCEDSLLGMLNMDLDRFNPFWFVRRLAVRQDVKGPTGLQVSRELINSSTYLAEKLGYYQFYSLVPTKYAKAHHRLWSSVPARNGRYVSLDIENVNPNAHPGFRLLWDRLYGRVTYPLGTTVRFSVCTDKDAYHAN